MLILSISSERYIITHDFKDDFTSDFTNDFTSDFTNDFTSDFTSDYKSDITVYSIFNIDNKAELTYFVTYFYDTLI